MIYCKLKEKKDSSAIYYVGASTEDMTGEVIFYQDLRLPELIKQADVYPVRENPLFRVYLKYTNNFANGEFRDKLSVEIG